MYFDNKFSTRPLRFASTAKDYFRYLGCTSCGWCLALLFFCLILCSFHFEFVSLLDLEKIKMMTITSTGILLVL